MTNRQNSPEKNEFPEKAKKYIEFGTKIKIRKLARAMQNALINTEFIFMAHGYGASPLGFSEQIFSVFS